VQDTRQDGHKSRHQHSEILDGSGDIEAKAGLMLLLLDLGDESTTANAIVGVENGDLPH
jgi:hypothetical protein